MESWNAAGSKRSVVISRNMIPAMSSDTVSIAKSVSCDHIITVTCSTTSVRLQVKHQDIVEVVIKADAVSPFFGKSGIARIALLIRAIRGSAISREECNLQKDWK
jgi:hypothetical protein